MAPRVAQYMLRKTLPPWKPHETIDELVELMPRYRVDEVIFKIDVEEFTHGLPTVDYIEQFIPWLKEARDKLAAVGVRTSINPWVTTVHCDRGRDCRAAHPDVQFVVGHDGTECRACACPLSPAWRELTCKLYALYASVKPEVLWIEDDIRTFNHRPARYACFCDIHLKEFERRTGEHRTREKLVANILAPGKPHPDRKRWFDLLGDVMVDVGAMFERAVHAVSPDTRLGLMTSNPVDHALEGRRWEDFCEAIAGPHPLVVRPCMGNYSETNARGLYTSASLVRRTMFCLPRPVRPQTEMESFPFTLYSKSCAFTRLQNAMSFVLGAEGVTMNIFDHCASPMENWPEYGLTLPESKPLLNAIAERCLPDPTERGVGILHHVRGSDEKQLSPNADYADLAQKSDGWMGPIESLGMSVTFQPSPVRAVTGQVLRAYSRDQVERFLGEGLLLDLSAAETLLDLGMGKLIGLREARRLSKLTRPIGAEEYPDADFGGPDTYSTLTRITANEELAELELDQAAEPISMFVDPDRRQVATGMYLFENARGGRVAVYPFDLSEGTGVSFLNEHRRCQLRGVIRWLGSGTLPLVVDGGVYPWAIRHDYPEYTIIAVANLSLDPWPQLTMTLSTENRTFDRVERAHTDGTWKPCKPVDCKQDERHVTLTFDLPVPPTDIAVFALWA